MNASRVGKHTTHPGRAFQWKIARGQNGIHEVDCRILDLSDNIKTHMCWAEYIQWSRNLTSHPCALRVLIMCTTTERFLNYDVQPKFKMKCTGSSVTHLIIEEHVLHVLIDTCMSNYIKRRQTTIRIVFINNQFVNKCDNKRCFYQHYHT